MSARPSGAALMLLRQARQGGNAFTPNDPRFDWFPLSLFRELREAGYLCEVRHPVDGPRGQQTWWGHLELTPRAIGFLLELESEETANEREDRHGANSA